jgi:hypothetical protein
MVNNGFKVNTEYTAHMGTAMHSRIMQPTKVLQTKCIASVQSLLTQTSLTLPSTRYGGLLVYKEMEIIIIFIIYCRHYHSYTN